MSLLNPKVKKPPVGKSRMWGLRTVSTGDSRPGQAPGYTPQENLQEVMQPQSRTENFNAGRNPVN
jgi:hypothetical protein